MSTLKEHIKRIWLLSRKNIKLYVKKGPVLIFGLFFPFFLTLSWIIGRSISTLQIFVGIVSMTSFFTATAISPVVLPIETRERSLEKQLSMPISLEEILISIVVASVIYSCLIAYIMMSVFLIILPPELLQFSQLITVIIGIFLLTIAASLLGVLASAYPTDQTSNVMILINLIKFPMVFVAGIFIPLSTSSPIEGIITSLFSPVTFLSDMLHIFVGDAGLFGVLVDILALFIWIAILLVMSIYMHRKTIVKRFSSSKGKKKQMMQNKEGMR
ncbi:MAG: ABC transporter permease [Promethearchaeota archaeon]